MEELLGYWEVLPKGSALLIGCVIGAAFVCEAQFLIAWIKSRLRRKQPLYLEAFRREDGSIIVNYKKFPGSTSAFLIGIFADNHLQGLEERLLLVLKHLRFRIWTGYGLMITDCHYWANTMSYKVRESAQSDQIPYLGYSYQTQKGSECKTTAISLQPRQS